MKISTRSLWVTKPLKNKAELLKQCERIEGLSFQQLATLLGTPIPALQTRRKGWAGMAIELALGATAGTKPLPDFAHLGIELKTLPLNHEGKPAESTFVTSIPLLTIHQQEWINSQCRAKLLHILWIPIEGERTIPFEQRRIGRGFLWSLTPEDERILANDWQELTFMMSSGRLEEIDAKMGEYLQVRPKAASSKSLCHGFDEFGNKILTLPRGFYLRSRFTSHILNSIIENQS
jgi:DNA mismatch repair protein MutH